MTVSVFALVVGLPVVVSAGVDVGAIIDATNRELDMSHKQCWLECEIDGASWSRMLRGEAPADLWRLRHLPLKWWQVFLGKFASALIRRRFDEMCGELRMVKADLRRSEERTKVS